MTERDPYISITRTFDASPEAAFEAWTSPTEFGRWFGTESTAVEDVRMDLRVGGHWSARMILGDELRLVGTARIWKWKPRIVSS
jgi:uncharacterized protein YndB with AHSA1/START domain